MTRIRCYKLNETFDVVPDENPDNPWAFNGDGISQRRIGLEIINDYEVSTVFLAYPHGERDGDPILFETMIFPLGKGHTALDGWGSRYTTYKEAKAGHDFVCNYIRNRVK